MNLVGTGNMTVDSLELNISRPVVLPIKLTDSQVRPIAYRILSKKHGLNLKSSALEVLTEFLGQHFGVDWRSSKSERLLDKIAKLWKEQDLGLFVEGEALTAVIRDVLNIQGGSVSSVSMKTTTTLETFTKTISDDNVEMMELDTMRTTSMSTALEKPFKWSDYFFTLNAQEQPYFKYNKLKRHFEYVSNYKKSLISSAQQLVNLFNTRYDIIHDRILRNELFQKNGFQPLAANMTASMSRDDFYALSMIKNMIGRNNSQFMLFGLLTKGGDGGWWLQDTSGKVKLVFEFEHAAIAQGTYYCPGSFILCQGLFKNEQFYVISLGPPPAENREVTKEAYGNMDFLGLHARQSTTATSKIDRIDKGFEDKLEMHEREFPDHRIIVLGTGIFLDELRTIDALRKIFTRLIDEVESGIRAQLPIAIVFLGSFISTPFSADGSSSSYKEGWDFLAQLLADFKSIVSKCKLIFVPGDNDPYAATFSSGATPTWPLSPIPSVFTSRMKRVAPNAVWASNPSRMSYLSQEVAIVRDDYGGRFRRNCLVVPEDAEEETSEIPMTSVTRDPDDEDLNVDDEVTSSQRALSHLVEQNTAKIKTRRAPFVAADVAEARRVVRTLLDQSHLSPFPLSIRPVGWSYDHTLFLSPLPSLLILGDSTTPMFKVTYEGCHVINPGPFLDRSKINWTEYSPSAHGSEHRFIYL